MTPRAVTYFAKQISRCLRIAIRYSPWPVWSHSCIPRISNDLRQMDVLSCPFSWNSRLFIFNKLVSMETQASRVVLAEEYFFGQNEMKCGELTFLVNFSNQFFVPQSFCDGAKREDRSSYILLATLLSVHFWLFACEEKQNLSIDKCLYLIDTWFLLKFIVYKN